MATASSDVDTDASLVYNYHRMHMSLGTPQLPADPSTAIFVLCSFDTRVAIRAAELYHAGHGHHLIFSGNVSVLTSGRFTLSEAEHFANVAREMGVPEAAIIVEPRATNTGENVRFTSALLAERGLLSGPERIRRFLLVQKPYMERRTYATFVKQWPNSEEVEFSVTSPVLEWDEYLNEENDRGIVLNAMVGDLVRIREYPARGFQIPQEIPQDVWDAGQRLIAAGYNKHLP
ncbi:DUF218 domain-containing protein [Roridomyces roridus]|uniref:DUF218 domain-containing protein n=1 Tax=Roridomyces roridus TaxID=1738132 RepID=A0AAD7FWU4_9AGAR|nr:DUF218 domain-containing protein [Roridomyces roridus]